MTAPYLVKKCLAEATGSFAIVFFGCGFMATANQQTSHLTPLIFGATVAFMIYAVGHLSGAHFNPAVTLGFAAIRRFPTREVGYYILSQVAGALAAATLLAVIFPDAASLGVTQTKVALWSAFFIEVILTFFLMFVIVAVATDSRAVGTMAGLAIGLTVMIGAFWGGPLTGASMNPGRSIGPAILAGEFGQLWLYLLAPVVGAVAAALLYEFIRCEDNQSEGSDQPRHVKGCC